MAKPRTPTNLLKLKGTYEANKKTQQNRIDDNLPMLSPTSYIEAPSSLTNSQIISLWYNTTSRLLQWQILAEPDLIQLEQAFIYLQELQKATIDLQATSFSDDTYSTKLKNHIKLVTAFNSIANKFGFNPVERSRLTLTAMEVKKNETILDKIKKG